VATALGKRPARNPRRKDVIAPRQVSWLAGHSAGLAFPAGLALPVTRIDRRSPLTVAGAAPAWAWKAAPASRL